MNLRTYFLGYWGHWSEGRQTSLHILFVSTIIFLILPITLPVEGEKVMTIHLLLAFWQAFATGTDKYLITEAAQNVSLILLTQYLLTVGAVFVGYLLVPPQAYKKWRHHNK